MIAEEEGKKVVLHFLARSIARIFDQVHEIRNRRPLRRSESGVITIKSKDKSDRNKAPRKSLRTSRLEAARHTGGAELRPLK